MNPPPPPPHGEHPKSSGLPPGKYDIFIIPEHSSGSGFLYLPSLRPNVNSFAAGFASALIIVVIGSALAPVLQAWWNGVKGSGGMVMILLIFAIAVGAWALGRAQIDAGPGPGGGGPPPSANGHAGAHSGAHSNSNGYANGHAGGAPPQASGPPPSSGPPPGAGAGTGPKPTWQRSTPAPGATGATPKPNMPGSASSGAWEKAREETRKREEERKAKEADKKRREELEKRLKELREKEARERESREKKLKDEEGKDKETERQKERQKDLERAKERLKELAKESSKPPPSTYAFSSTGEKINPWPQGRPASPSPASKPRPQSSSPIKKPPPPPTAKTYLGTEDDAYSYRPYDQPKRPLHKKTPSSIYSESSYAASHSTSHTTPPPSNRGPYRTKDPDKIVIKAVYSFNNAFLKTPTSQLVSGVGTVTDGLILRITTEGLFIDDDVRGVPQREWDVKAWTMKLVEVWCPSFGQGPAGNSAFARVAAPKSSNPVRRLWGLDKDKAATSEETDALLVSMLQLCKENCLLPHMNGGGHTGAAAHASSSSATSSVYSASSYASSSAFDGRASASVSDSAYGSSIGSSSPRENLNSKTNQRGAKSQTGELKSARLHVLRASIRDQEGKKYLFVITEEESWKVAVGLQKLRKGAQVRALGVSGMSTNDARGTLENLGWA